MSVDAAVTVRICGSRDAVGRADFIEDVADVARDGVHGDQQGVSNFAVALAAAQRTQLLSLRLGDACETLEKALGS